MTREFVLPFSLLSVYKMVRAMVYLLKRSLPGNRFVKGLPAQESTFLKSIIIKRRTIINREDLDDSYESVRALYGDENW